MSAQVTSIFQPDWVSPPGATIAEALKEKNILLPDFAKRINVSTKYLGDLLQGKAKLTEEIACELELKLGASVEFWLTRELQFQEDTLRAQKVLNDVWVKTLPYNDMVKFGWIEKTRDKVDACLDFFNIKNIDEWNRMYEDRIASSMFRGSNAYDTHFASVAAWLRQGEIVGDKTECKPWNEEIFISKLKELRKLSRIKYPKDFLPTLINSCSECGVAVVIVRAPNGCRASGATRFISANKAILQLSFRHMSDDQFWFTFFHEAGHLVLHGKQSLFIEDMGISKSSADLEDEANIFASEMLIPHEMQPQLARLKGNTKNIIRFALEIGVSPGIIVGQLQHRGYIQHKYLNGFKRWYTWEHIPLQY